MNNLSNKSPSEVGRRTLVLMTTFNGAKYLDGQLASIASQTIDNIDIIVSDDGSSDGTLDILALWKSRWHKGLFYIAVGPATGFSDNFRNLLLTNHPHYDYYAFSDQDDVWDNDKLSVAIDILSRRAPGVLRLYCSRSRLVDEYGRPLGTSPLFPHPPSFKNAIVQSLAGGNTMVMNAEAFALVQETARRTKFLMHDWWAYLMISGAGGEVYYDKHPRISYRQHGGNAIGGRLRLRERPRRIIELLAGKYVHWTDANIAALERCVDLLSQDSRETLRNFKLLRTANPLTVVARLLRSGIYRQTVKGNLALGVAALLRRL